MKFNNTTKALIFLSIIGTTYGCAKTENTQGIAESPQIQHKIQKNQFKMNRFTPSQAR